MVEKKEMPDTYSEIEETIINRRPVITGLGVGTVSALTGQHAGVPMTQEFEDPGEADNMSFDGDLSISWVAERFIELDSADHPAVGTELTCRGVVVTELAGEVEREAFGAGLQWGRFAENGDATLGRFFRPIEQFSRSNTTIGEDIYDQFALVRLAGVESADQDFYDKYDFSPYVWAVVNDRSELPAGTVVEVDAVIRHSSEIQEIEGFQGPFLEVRNTSEVEQLRSLTIDTEVGESADFVGVQTLDSPVLSAYTADVQYSYERRFAVPDPGSLVHHAGSVTAHDFESSLPRENRAELATNEQDILIGRRRDESYDTAFGEGDQNRTPNTVAVVDVSGSMSEEDTRTGASRIEVARESAASLLQFLPDEHNLGIAAFSTDANTVAAMTELDGERNRLAEEVRGLRPGGDTSIGAGLLEALELLDGRDRPQSILLLSDGEENTPPSVSDVLPDVRDRGIRVFTIGMGSGISPDVLRDMANQTGGDVRISPDPEDTRAFFQQLSAGVQRREELSFTGEKLGEGETTGGTASIDESVGSVQFSLSYPGSLIRLEVQRPDGTVLSEGDSGVEHRVSGSSEAWDLDSPEAGEWSYTAIGEELPEPERATIEVSADTPVQTELFITDDIYEQTGTFKLELKAIEGRSRYTGATATLIAEHLDTGKTAEISLNDDGTGGDPVDNDGIYTGYFHPESAGEYTFTAVLERGPYESLRREHEETVVVEEVVDQAIRLYEDDGFFTSLELDKVGIVGLILLVFAGTVGWVMRLLSADVDE